MENGGKIIILSKRTLNHLKRENDRMALRTKCFHDLIGEYVVSQEERSIKVTILHVR